MGFDASRKLVQYPNRFGDGACFRSEPVDDELSRRLAEMCRGLGFFGMFEAEFIEEDGRKLLIDFNPRLFNGLALPVARGLRLPSCTTWRRWAAWMRSKRSWQRVSACERAKASPPLGAIEPSSEHCSAVAGHPAGCRLRTPRHCDDGSPTHRHRRSTRPPKPTIHGREGWTASPWLGGPCATPGTSRGPSCETKTVRRLAKNVTGPGQTRVGGRPGRAWLAPGRFG